MKRRLVGVLMVMVLAALAFSALGAVGEDVCNVATRVMPEACVTQTDLLVALDQVFGNCGDGVAASVDDIVAAFIDKGFLPNDFVLAPDACVTKGFVSQILNHALGLRPGLIDRVRIAVSGLSPAIATKIAQENCLMVTGDAEDTMTGREFVASLYALIKHEIHTEPLPCGAYREHLAQLKTWFAGIQQVMPKQEAAEYIPCLIKVPTS